jgi:hypothetical protein
MVVEAVVEGFVEEALAETAVQLEVSTEAELVGCLQKLAKQKQ